MNADDYASVISPQAPTACLRTRRKDILIIIGYRVRLVAILFFLWLIPTTFIAQLINFEKNVSIMGAMLLLFAFGPGVYSLDSRRNP